MKHLKYIILIFVTLSAVSCEDDWLKIRPLSIYSPESLYIDAKGFEGLLVTLRSNLREEYVTSGFMPFKWEYITTDLAVHGVRVLHHNLDTELLPTITSNNDVHDCWKIAFGAIRNANVVISRVDQVDMPQADRNRILAEGYFHRSFWYYRLVHQYGDVPFMSKEYTAPKIDFNSHSRKTILDRIQSDMEFAVTWLPEQVVPGAVNRGAGNHLLTKIYLANSAFDKAVISATAVINGGFSLMRNRFGVVAGNPHFNVIWDLHQKENKSIPENKEVILVYQDKYGLPGASPAGTKSMRTYTPAWHGNLMRDPAGKPGMTDARGNWQIISLGRGNGNIRATNYHNYEIWTDPADLRCDPDTNWFPNSKLRYNHPASKYYGQIYDPKYTIPADTFQRYYPWPYYKLYVEDERVPDQPNGGHSDWYIFRLAETFLLRAEAHYWQGNLGSAAIDINEVRHRANASSVGAGEVSIEYILDERARELYAEEPRKTELTRIAYIMADNNLNGYDLTNFSNKNYFYDRVMDKNIFYRTNYNYGNNPYKISSYHVLWPVPAEEITSNQGGRINQNIGYDGAELNLPPLKTITDEQ